jgi:hypothetical protein
MNRMRIDLTAPLEIMFHSYFRRIRDFVLRHKIRGVQMETCACRGIT